MGNYQARFWRAAALVKGSLTLIVAAGQIVVQRGLVAVGHTLESFQRVKSSDSP